MGFLDKAKEQASALANKAQEGISQGQAKLDAQQAKRQADGLLRDLGAWVYAQHTGRDNGEAAANIERIYSELQAHEADHGQLGSEKEPEAPTSPLAEAEAVAPSFAAPQPPPPGPPQGSPTMPPPSGPPVEPVAPPTSPDAAFPPTVSDLPASPPAEPPSPGVG